MTRDEVMAMTDEELRIKAGWLRGWDLIAWRAGELTGNSPDPELDGCRMWGPYFQIPNFPRCIAASMDLIDHARADDWWWSASYRTSCVDMDFGAAGYAVRLRCVRGATRPDVYTGDSDLARANTRAFIMAMTGGDDDQG